MPIISVIMPVYNSENYIRETIESILDQSYKDFELLILNDNSSDNSLKIIKQYQEKDSRIIVINKEKNVGPANLRNEGFRLSKGGFIALMDADDIALPTRFEKQVAVLEKNPEIGVCGTWFTFFGAKKNKVIRHSENHDAIKISFLHSCGIGNPTVMLRKEMLFGLEFDNDFVPVEDYDLWSRLLEKTKFHNIQESLLNYRQHENNISKTKIENVNRSIKLVKINLLKQFGVEKTDRKIEFYINAISLHKGLLPSDIVNTIEVSRFLIAQNKVLGNFDSELLQKEFEKTLLRTIRNSGKNNFHFFNHLKKHEKELFQKMKFLDKIVLFFKSIF